MRRAARLAVAAVCLAALLGLCVHYGAAYDEGWPHPTGDQLRAEYDAHVGDRVLLFGEVQSVDREADAAVIHVTDDADDVAAEIELQDVPDGVGPGGTVQVYGVLEADGTDRTDGTMAPDRTVVVNRDSSAVLYKLGTSAVGGLLAVGYFLRYWTVDPRALAFEPRSTATTRTGDPATAAPAEDRRDG